MKTLRSLPWLAALFLAACSVSSYRIDYRTVPKFPAGEEGLRVVVVGVDAREDLKLGEIDPPYVGMVRDGVGVPWRVHTLSLNPAVNDLAYGVAQGLKESGVRAISVVNPVPGSMASAMEAARKTGRSRIIVVKADVLESDTLIHTEFRYGFTFLMLDRQGNILASNHVSGDPTLGGSVYWPYQYATTAVPSKVRCLMVKGVTPLLKEL